MKGSFKHGLAIAGLKLKKASPHIMAILGVGGIIYTVIDSCKRARKLDEALKEELEELNKAIEELKETQENTEAAPEVVKEAKKKVRSARFKCIRKGAKLFLVPTLIGLASITLIGGSHYILTNRLVGTSAALQAVTAEYKAYRESAVEKFGEEVDKELRFGKAKLDAKEAELTKVDEETGEATTEKTTVYNGVGIEGFSGYAIPFCKTYCGGTFTDNHHMDTCTIFDIMDQCDKDLIRKGYLFLDDVYKKFNFDPTPASRRVGWLINEDGTSNGDGRVRFTMEEGYYDWGNGPEKTYFIDFNVDGEIDNLLPKPKKKWWNTKEY